MNRCFLAFVLTIYCIATACATTTGKNVLTQPDTLKVIDIEEVVKASKEADKNTIVKVIIETCYLSKEEIEKATEIVVLAGADFVKTSTGFGTGGATLEDVKLMKKVAGNKVEVKASGGISDAKTAAAMIEAGATRLGVSKSIAIVTGENAANDGSY